MPRKLRLLMVLGLLPLLFTFTSWSEPGRALTVDAANPASEDLDGDSVFRTITAAVAAAAPGGLIKVAPGRYDRALGERFPITIDKDLAIETRGGPAETIIDAGGAIEAIEIRGGSVIFRGFTLQRAGGTKAAGIAVMGKVGNIEISNNVVQDIAAESGSYSFGIRIYQVSSGKVAISNNSVQQVAGNGISVGHSSAAIAVRGNLVTEIARATIDDLEYSVGIAVNAASGVVVEGNRVSGATLGISLMGSTSCTVRGNRLTDNLQRGPISYAGAEFTAPGAGVLVAFDSHDNLILENEVRGNGVGIGLYLADDNRIERNTMSDNGATTVTLEGVTVHGLGIALDYSHRNRVLDNTIENNGDVGIVLKDAALNVVSDNVINNHRDSGILIHDGVRDAANIIERNVIEGTVGAGIRIKSGYSEIRQNELTANGMGIELLETAEAKDHWVHDNEISGNRFGLRNGGQGMVRAKNNWWGDVSGPYHPRLNTAGKGDAVSNNVDFRPWRTAQVRS